MSRARAPTSTPPRDQAAAGRNQRRSHQARRVRRQLGPLAGVLLVGAMGAWPPAAPHGESSVLGFANGAQNRPADPIGTVPWGVLAASLLLLGLAAALVLRFVRRPRDQTIPIADRQVPPESTCRDALVRERALLRAILDQVADGVVALDADGQVLLWNRPAREMLGMGPCALAPTDWPGHFGLHPSPGAAPIPGRELALVRALAGETPRPQALFVHNPGHPEGRWISMLARPLGAPLAPTGVVAVLEDGKPSHQASARREAETRELERIGRLTLIAQIVDTTVHRLSQPLAAIANYTGAAIQLRALGRLDDLRLEEILGHISRLAERTGETLESLRALTRRGSRPLGPVDIPDLIQGALELLEDRLERQGIAVERAIAADLPPVQGQSAELQQAIIHLLINAMEALAAREPPRYLHVVTARSPLPHHIRILVGDNGPGVPPDRRGHIFEPWLSTKEGGLGLGLAVARGIAEKHNGALSLEDTADGITWFSIDLPCLDEIP